ncbi:hypothetical protein BT63DRAFT_436858 [Microthyrium microscopicum]|uniref:Uncharacterized protein n=1 Tax=Microthyrium microscopicum TaxID=703497 RepID=A0A6A6ULA1_9PEZI|nr:hypothetical protein BT63DRAFT_436858 [Microthyrium microscopicum]
MCWGFKELKLEDPRGIGLPPPVPVPRQVVVHHHGPPVVARPRPRRRTVTARAFGHGFRSCLNYTGSASIQPDSLRQIQPGATSSSPPHHSIADKAIKLAHFPPSIQNLSSYIHLLVTLSSIFHLHTILATRLWLCSPPRISVVFFSTSLIHHCTHSLRLSIFEPSNMSHRYSDLLAQREARQAAAAGQPPASVPVAATAVPLMQAIPQGVPPPAHWPAQLVHMVQPAVQVVAPARPTGDAGPQPFHNPVHTRTYRPRHSLPQVSGTPSPLYSSGYLVDAGGSVYLTPPPTYNPPRFYQAYQPQYQPQPIYTGPAYMYDPRLAYYQQGPPMFAAPPPPQALPAFPSQRPGDFQGRTRDEVIIDSIRQARDTHDARLLASRNMKPDAKAGDMFWVIEPDGQQNMYSFATIDIGFKDKGVWKTNPLDQTLFFQKHRNQ